MKNNTIYYIPLVGAAKYIIDVEHGDAFVSSRTDLLFAYHFLWLLGILILTTKGLR